MRDSIRQVEAARAPSARAERSPQRPGSGNALPSRPATRAYADKPGLDGVGRAFLVLLKQVVESEVRRGVNTRAAIGLRLLRDERTVDRWFTADHTMLPTAGEIIRLLTDPEILRLDESRSRLFSFLEREAGRVSVPLADPAIGSLESQALDISAAVGELAAGVAASVNPEGPGGSGRTPEELDEIAAALLETRNRIDGALAGVIEARRRA